MLVWSSPAQNYYDPRYCHNEDYGCDIVMSKQEAIWVNAIAFLGCIFCVPVAGEICDTLKVNLHPKLFDRVFHGQNREKVDNDWHGSPICPRYSAHHVCRKLSYAHYWSSSLRLLLRRLWAAGACLHLGDRGAEHQGRPGQPPAAYRDPGCAVCWGAGQVCRVETDDWHLPLHPSPDGSLDGVHARVTGVPCGKREDGTGQKITSIPPGT